MPHPELHRLPEGAIYRMITDRVQFEDRIQLEFSDPIRCLRVEDGVLQQGRGDVISHDEFNADAFRCTDDGMPILPVDTPISFQVEALRADSDVKPAGIPINIRPPFRFEAGHDSNQLPAGFRH